MATALNLRAESQVSGINTEGEILPTSPPGPNGHPADCSRQARPLAAIAPDEGATSDAERDFDSRFDEFRSVAIAAARRAGASRELAEDMAQEASLKLLKKMRGGSRPDRPRAWLAQVTLNGAITAFRRNREFQGEPAFFEARPGRAAVPWGEDVLAAIESLPPDLRAIADRRFLDEAKVTEVARTLGVSRSTIHRRIEEARALLADRLIALYGDELPVRPR